MRMRFLAPAVLLSFALVTGCSGADSGDTSPLTLGDGGTTDATSATSSANGPTSSISDSDSDSATSSDPTDAATTTSAATTSAATSADSSTGETPTVVWNRYTFDVAAQTWSTIALDQVWVEPNAPPVHGIEAAVSLTHFDRLYVLAIDGTLYERVDGDWQSPTPITTRFPMLEGLSVGAMTHVPGQENETTEEVYFIDNPTAVIYVVHEEGTVEHSTTATMEDEPDGAPQGTGRALWYFAITDPAGIGKDPNWLQWYVAYDDGNLYRFNAAFEWSSWPLTDNPFFGVSAGQPDPMQIEAAYHDDELGRIHFIGP